MSFKKPSTPTPPIPACVVALVGSALGDVVIPSPSPEPFVAFKVLELYLEQIRLDYINLR